MKAELTVADAAAISNKMTTQPYKPPSQTVVACDMFPVDEEEHVLYRSIDLGSC